MYTGMHQYITRPGHQGFLFNQMMSSTICSWTSPYSLARILWYSHNNCRVALLTVQKMLLQVSSCHRESPLLPREILVRLYTRV